MLSYVNAWDVAFGVHNIVAGNILLWQSDEMMVRIIGGVMILCGLYLTSRGLKGK